MKIIQVPEAAEFLDPTPVEQYPYNKTFDEAKREPFMVLHSSGSTGLPKPITIYHSVLATVDAHHLIETAENDFKLHTSYWTRTRYYCSFPFFHVGLIFCAQAYVSEP